MPRAPRATTTGKRSLEASSAAEPPKKKQAKATASKPTAPAKEAKTPKATKAKATPKSKTTKAKPDGPPLSTSLSKILVALSIEADNEFESTIDHSRAEHPDGRASYEVRSTTRPWLTSIAMYYNCLQFVPVEGGITYGEMTTAAKTHTPFAGMLRWGYVIVNDPKYKTGKPKPDAVVSLTTAGIMAKKAWEKILPDMEYKWNARYGAQLRGTLWGVVKRFDKSLPDCMPVLTLGYANDDTYEKISEGEELEGNEGTICLLSKVLLMLAKEFEEWEGPSLSTTANVLRVANEGDGYMSTFAQRAGIGSAAVMNAVKYIEKIGLANQIGGGKQKKIVLTAKGKKMAEDYYIRLYSIEEEWAKKYGEKEMEKLRVAARNIVDGHDLMKEMNEGYNNCWRALEKKQPETLPHYPLVTHRGGYPDGS